MLAVFFPFAAIGLWMLASWGPVIWFICAVTETVMYVGFPEMFGKHADRRFPRLRRRCSMSAFRIVIPAEQRTRSSTRAVVNVRFANAC